MQIFNEMEKSKQEKYSLHGLSSKGAPGSVNEISPVLKKIKSLKKNLMINVGKTHLCKLPVCENEVQKSLSHEKTHLNSESKTTLQL